MTAFLMDRRVVLGAGTVERYGRAMVLFRRYLGERAATFTFAQMTRDELRNFFGWLRSGTGRHGRQRTEDTARKAVEVVQLGWKWLHNEDTTGTVPPPKTYEMPRSVPALPSPPSWEEMDRCVRACLAPVDADGRARTPNVGLYRLAVLLRFTGLRVDQAMHIEWSHVDLDACTLQVVRGKSAQEKRGRVIPISEHLVAELATWGVREGFVVDMKRGGARERQARPRDMMRAWQRAGVRPEAWKGSPHHAFRDGFQSGLKKLGADDEAVKFLVGHSRGLRGLYIGPEYLPVEKAVALVPPLGGTSVVAMRVRGTT